MCGIAASWHFGKLRMSMQRREGKVPIAMNLPLKLLWGAAAAAEAAEAEAEAAGNGKGIGKRKQTINRHFLSATPATSGRRETPLDAQSNDVFIAIAGGRGLSGTEAGRGPRYPQSRVSAHKLKLCLAIDNQIYVCEWVWTVCVCTVSVPWHLSALDKQEF